MEKLNNYKRFKNRMHFFKIVTSGISCQFCSKFMLVHLGFLFRSSHSYDLTMGKDARAALTCLFSFTLT